MGNLQIEVGRTIGGKPLLVDVHLLQGINIIAGLKYTGKTQLVKSILRQFAEKKVGCMVLDTEGLYTAPDPRGADELVTLRPGVELRLPSSALDTNTLLDVMEIIGLNDVALGVLFEKIQAIGERDVSIDKLRTAMREEQPAIRGQINRGLELLERTKLIADEALTEAVTDLREMIVGRLNEGRVLAIDFTGMGRMEIRIALRLLMTDVRLFESGKLKPLFLFAKEVHTYVNETDLEDFVLRTSRLGLWQFYVTNMPLELPGFVVRRADNLFCFYLGLQEDIRHLAPAARMNVDAFQKTVSALTRRQFLAAGRATDDEPLILQVEHGSR